jgi:hypothetical protein
MTEFDPTSEKHMFGFLVKMVDPGCTLELQIEEANGTVTRLTSTENPAHDREQFHRAIAEVAERLFKTHSI